VYCDIVLIDQIGIDGILTGFRLMPRDSQDRVVVDDLRDIVRSFGSPDSRDVGGVRVYNASYCKIHVTQARLRALPPVREDGRLAFSLEHHDIPVPHLGFYNCVLPVGYHFKRITFTDPRRPEKINPFRYTHERDVATNASIIRLELRSRYGAFSFRLEAEAATLRALDHSEFLRADESKDAISHILDYTPFLEGHERIQVGAAIHSQQAAQVHVHANAAYFGGRHVNQKNVTVQGGSGVTVVNVAEYISGVTTTVTQNLEKSAAAEDVKKLVAALPAQLAKLPPTIDPKVVTEIGDNAKALSEELARPEPRRKWYELSLSGLKEAAEAIGAVGKPIVESAVSIAKLLGAALS